MTALLACFMGAACGGQQAGSGNEGSVEQVVAQTVTGGCASCLEAGGTWQPELSGAERCTTDCGVQDISCYSDSCPEPQTTCEACVAGGGTWQPELGEAERCTDDCGVQDISCYRESCPGS